MTALMTIPRLPVSVLSGLFGSAPSLSPPSRPFTPTAAVLVQYNTVRKYVSLDGVAECLHSEGERGGVSKKRRLTPASHSQLALSEKPQKWGDRVALVVPFGIGRPLEQQKRGVVVVVVVVVVGGQPVPIPARHPLSHRGGTGHAPRFWRDACDFPFAGISCGPSFSPLV